MGRVTAMAPVEIGLLGPERMYRATPGADALPLTIEDGIWGGQPALVVMAQAAMAPGNDQSRADMLLDAASDLALFGGWRTDLKAQKVEATTGVYQAYGFPPGTQFDTATAMDCFAADDRARLERAFADTVARQTPFDGTMQITALDGKTKWLRVQYRAELNPSAEVQAVIGFTQDVTELIQLRVKLQAQAQHVSDVVSNMPEPFCLLDRDLRFTYCNEATTALTRAAALTDTDMLGQLLFDRRPELRARMEGPLAAILAGGPPVTITLLGLPTDRHLVAFLHGTADGVAIHIRDMTDQRRAQLALQQSEERYRLAMLAAQDVIFDWDAQNDILILSEATKARYGYDPAVFPRTIADLKSIVHPDDRGRFDHFVALTESAANPEWSETYRLIRADGTVAHVIDRGHAVLGANGEVLREIGTLTDVTELRAHEEKIQLGMTATTDVIFILDFDTGIHWWSDNMLHHYGHDPNTGPPMVERWFDLIHPDDQDHVRQSHQTAINSGADHWEGEYRLHHADGHYVHIRDRARFIRHEDGRIARSVGTMNDVSDSYRENQIRGLETQVLDLVSAGAPQCEIMRLIMATIDVLLPGRHSTMVVAEGNRLRWIEPPNLPRNFCIGTPDEDTNQNLINGIWGQVILSKDIMVIPDIELDETWRKDCTDVQVAGLRACWALPIRGSDGAGLGSITVFSPQFGQPLAADVALIERIGRFARVAIERTRSTAALQLSEERYRLALQAAQDVMFDWDIVNDTLIWSESACARFGLLKSELPRTKAEFVALLHPQDRVRMEAATMVGVTQGLGEPWTTSYDMRRGDGTYARILENALFLFDDDGNPVRMVGMMADITQATRDLERNQALAEIGSDAVLEYDPATDVFNFDAGFRTVFGIDLYGDHPVADALVKHFHPDDRTYADQGYFAFVASGQSTTTKEYRLQRGDGSYANVQERIVVLHDAAGHARRVFSAIIDISDLRLSEERFRIAAIASQEVIFDMDMATDQVSWSPDGQIRFGYDTSRFPKTLQHFLQKVHPDDRIRMAQSVEQLKLPTSGQSLSNEPYRFIRADGSIAHVVSRAMTVSGPEGRPTRLVGMMFDVSALRDEEDRMRAILEVASDAVFEYDVGRNIMVFSDGLRTHFGHDWTGEQSIPSQWQQAVHPDDAARVYSDFMSFVNGTDIRWRSAYRMRRGDDTWAFVEERVVALRDQDGRALRVIGSLDDMTEQRRLEDQLHTAQKMESIGRISGGIAHDFNNLLAVIMGNAELTMEMFNQPGSDAVVQEFCKEIVDACLRGSELTRRLLSFARKSRLAPVVLDVNETVIGMSRLFHRTVPETIQIETSLTAGLWMTQADPAFLESALLNLVVNARDAMKGGGKLTIETSNLRVNDAYVELREEEIAPGRYVMLAVSDSGHGIPREVLAKVIEPFFTTKPPHLGSGLGLAMVHGFVKQSGGALRIYSEVGVGTTVKILLPVVANALDPVSVKTPDQVLVDRTPNARILLVEDEGPVRKIIARILTGQGISVTEAESGDAALAIFDNTPDAFDILLTDVVMPGVLQGPALARAIKERRPGLGIIFMSGYANEAVVHGNGLRRDDHFLMKPVQRADLLNVINLVLLRPLP